MAGAFEKQLKRKVAENVPHYHKEKTFLSEDLSRKSLIESKSSISSVNSRISSGK